MAFTQSITRKGAARRTGTAVVARIGSTMVDISSQEGTLNLAQVNGLLSTIAADLKATS